MQFDRIKYLEYINNSDEWKLKRKEVFLKKGKLCEKCGRGKKVNVHHGTYQRLFNEDMGDLFVLCNKCHKKYHEINKKITIESTIVFIKSSGTKPLIKKNKKKKKPFKIDPERKKKVDELKKLLNNGKIKKHEYFEFLRKL